MRKIIAYLKERRRYPDAKKVKLKLFDSSAGLLSGIKNKFIGTSFSPPIEASAIIDLRRWPSFQEYFDYVKKKNYKSCIYPYNRAVKKGFYSHRFEFKNFVPDVVAVNQSMPERQGKKMGDNYFLSVDDLGGAPKQFHELTTIENPERFRLFMGVFRKEDGRKQGEVETGEELVGYITLIREGDMIVYNRIIGHGEHLNDGIMYNLHFYIMEWLYGNDPLAQGVNYVMYASYTSGSEGLRKWKKRLEFEPTFLYQQ
ncbi:MAG: hypothetical protein KDD41_00795 [Flavobacteriales bacterium]|nr:hypothetical protein [Flavobacteriales bacterium]